MEILDNYLIPDLCDIVSEYLWIDRSYLHLMMQILESKQDYEIWYSMSSPGFREDYETYSYYVLAKLKQFKGEGWGDCFIQYQEYLEVI